MIQINEGVWSSMKSLANKLPSDRKDDCNKFAQYILDQSKHTEEALEDNLKVLESYVKMKIEHAKDIKKELVNRAFALYHQVLKMGDTYDYNEYDKDIAWFIANMFLFICFYNKKLDITDINNIYAHILNKLASFELGDSKSAKTSYTMRGLSMLGIIAGILSHYKWGPLFGNIIGMITATGMFWYLKFKRKKDVSHVINSGDFYSMKKELPVPDVSLQTEPEQVR